MPVQVPDDVFLAFLEAAAFEDGELSPGEALDPAQVARTAGLDLTTARSCVERLVAEGLGYVPKDEPEGFQIDAKRVGFVIRRLQRRPASPPAGQVGSTYNLQITGSTIASLATGAQARAIGEIHDPTSGGPILQGSGAPPAAAAPAQGSQSVASSGDAPIDFAILTAIEVERRAVCSAFGLGDDHRVKKGSRVYWRGRLSLKNGEAYELVVAQSPDMANVDAALLTSDMLHHWQPGAALMVGVAASTKPEEVKLGDVVAGSDVYYYERGKVTPSGTKPEPKMVPADATLWSNVTALPAWTVELPAQRPDGTSDRPKVHFGVIASGEKVLADEAARDQIAADHRKILAIEMEGYGFSKAVWQSFDRVRHLVIRGICDDGSPAKDDRWHGYAAASVAGFAKHFLLDRPLEPRTGTLPLEKLETPVSPTTREVPLTTERHPRVESLFVGRDAELQAMSEALLSQKAGSLMPVAIGALQGMPGVGKSYLADRFALLHQDRFPGGYHKFSIGPDGVRDVEELGGRVASLIGQRTWSGPHAWEDLKARLLSPAALLHIENVDGDEEVRPVVELARRLSGCAIVASGRSRRFGNGPEWKRIEVVPFDEAMALKQLTTELATPGVVIGKDHRTLVGVLGHLPLAIHLAAGYLKDGHSVDGFLALLRERGLDLEPADLDDPSLFLDRARTVLSTTFEISLALLRKQAREKSGSWLDGFVVMGHAPAEGVGRSLGAAMANLTELEFETLMVTAVRLSLASGSFDDGWRVHPLLREFLRYRVRDNKWRDRMTTWFVERLPRLDRGYEEEQGRRWKEIQREEAALVGWLNRLSPDEAVWVQQKGSWYAQFNGPFLAWMPFCEQLLATTQDARVRSDTLWTLCQMAMRSGAFERALDIARQKATVDNERGDPVGKILATRIMSEIHLERGNFDKALRLLRDEVLPAYEGLGDTAARNITLSEIADVYMEQNKLEEALQLLESEVLPECDRQSNRYGRGVVLVKIAKIEVRRGNFDRAFAQLQEALDIHEQFGNAIEAAVARSTMAIVHLAQGRLDEAIDIVEKDVLPVYVRAVERRHSVVARMNLARLLLVRNRSGDLARSTDLLRVALSDAEAMRIPEIDQIRLLQRDYGLLR